MVEFDADRDDVIAYFRGCVQRLIRNYSGNDVCLFFIGFKNTT